MPYPSCAAYILLLGTTASVAKEPLFSQSDVFKAGEDGVNIYRIPAVVVTKGGAVLAFCEAREAGDQSPTDVVLKRSLDQGATWQAMQIVVDGKGPEAIMNPCPAVDPTDGTVFLFCNLFPDLKAQYVPGRVRQLVLTSSDEGVTWSAARDISEEVSDTRSWASLCSGPGVAIFTQTGRLVVPMWHWEAGGRMDFINNVFYSDDRGKSWKVGGPVQGVADENQIVELSDGRLMMNSRVSNESPNRRRRKIAISEDGGLTWSEPFFDQSLISPTCQASILGYGRKLLFSHPNSEKDRVDMTVRMSEDDGKTWPVARSVFSGPSAYSCLATFQDGSIGVLFETGEKAAYEKISFARFNLEWLTDEKDR